MSQEDNFNQKLVDAKKQWAREGRLLTGQQANPDQDRLPPGQKLVTDWPILDLGKKPHVRLEDWRLMVDGAVTTPVSWNWQTFNDQPQSSLISDIHCVTQWSRYDNRWKGVSSQHLADVVQPLKDARYVLLHAYDGYVTNVKIEHFLAPYSLVAHSWEKAPLTLDHGGPARMIIPSLYLWKSAKWLSRIEFSLYDIKGFWEKLGYHNRGDPWKEERYR